MKYKIFIILLSIIVLLAILFLNKNNRETVSALLTQPIKIEISDLLKKCSDYTKVGRCPNGDYILYDLPNNTVLLTSLPDVYDSNGNSILYAPSRNTVCCSERKSYLYPIRAIQMKTIGCKQEESVYMCSKQIPVPSESISPNNHTIPTPYSTKVECEKKTHKGCQCMYTSIDSAASNPYCTGWEPVHF